MQFILKSILYTVILFIIKEFTGFIFKIKIPDNLVVILAIVLSLVTEII